MENLNQNDKKLLELCSTEKSVNQLSREIGISPSNVSARLPKLEGMGLILVDRQEKQGKKTKVRTKASIKVQEYILEALQKLKEKGEMSPLEFQQIFPLDFSDTNQLDKKNALAFIEFGSPSLVERVIRINEEGEKFLKEQSNKRHS